MRPCIYSVIVAFVSLSGSHVEGYLLKAVLPH